MGNEIVSLSERMNPESSAIVTSGYNNVNHNGDMFVQKPFEVGFFEGKNQIVFSRIKADYYLYPATAPLFKSWNCERRFSKSLINSSGGGTVFRTLWLVGTPHSEASLDNRSNPTKPR